jgi:pyridoxine 4-dehydrogenase
MAPRLLAGIRSLWVSIFWLTPAGRREGCEYRIEGAPAGSLAEPFETLAGLQRQGVIRHLGVSNATAEQVAEAQGIAPIVCMQTMYNLAYRHHDDLIDTLAGQGIAYVPFFPLGGYGPLQSEALSAGAARLDATPMSVALAWLMQRRSPDILLIPGTSSAEHLRENVAGRTLAPKR